MNLFKKSKILVIGDAMLDKYLFGSTNRISPEAPVPVLKIKEEILKPGGAANVAANLSSLGINTSLITDVGVDSNGKILRKLIKSLKVNLISKIDKNIITTTKTRIISQNQQLIRIDDECNNSKITENNIKKETEKAIKNSDAVIFSDYNKGSLANISQLIKIANKHKKPVFIDPKGDNFSCYKNAFAITPNLKEFENIVGACNDHNEIIKKAKKLSKTLNINSILVTLGFDGMLLIQKDKKTEYINATSKKEVFDVTGAGDTVIAVLCAAYLSSKDSDLYFAAIVSNIAAGEVIKQLGAQSIDGEELTSIVYKEINFEDELKDEYFKKFDELDTHNRIIKNDNELKNIINLIKSLGFNISFTNGCFDILHRGHTKYLDDARKLADFLFIGVNDDASVKKLKGKNRPVNNLNDRMEMLRRITLDDAFIIKFSEQTPIQLIKKIKPNILIKGGDYKANEIVGSDFVKKNGGKIKIIPFIKGFSTTNIIKKINKSTD
ncbi:MAG: D-glycero-beta-D-manno-heptose 1-phosphate adenylyltransferase [Gammaproteobacteria bacterium]|jgi:D-beta-D-heptose 7-phosphate kinase / D-beta-D-heptose 1-phosphate adenosyltransferase|nr:D-glycero-beta-D-manno-heptose 1-phosphate adenylyltransferase [Gammaproteobacteria bacterium]MBT7603908.1 D-glycero-beta-D-manno-heptose 1-phosphate adenylyltransferase [Gammaproteobacteria bacterium]